jgi:hypothetical protein
MQDSGAVPFWIPPADWSCSNFGYEEFTLLLQEAYGIWAGPKRGIECADALPKNSMLLLSGYLMEFLAI